MESPRRCTQATRAERGQILVLAAVFTAIVLGTTALAIDLGVFLSHARDAQNAADAVALAAAQELRDGGDQQAAIAAAQEWAAKNGVDLSDLDCCVFEDLRPIGDPDGKLDTVTAQVQSTSDTIFARTLDIAQMSLSRDATAQVAHARGAPVCPWAILGDETDTDPDDGDYYGIVPGQVYALKVAVGLQDEGNFRALDLGQQGASGYIELIENGCDSDEVGVWGEGDEILTDSKPGDMGNPTRQALNEYYSYEFADGTSDELGYGWCDVEFELDEEDPTVGQVTGSYDPYPQNSRDGCERNPFTGDMGRVVTIPVIDHLPNGASEPVTILGLSSLYIASWDREGPPSQTQVYGIFLDEADITPEHLVGVSDNPLAPLRILLIK
jgi:Flp pilus assembly protein TadG